MNEQDTQKSRMGFLELYTEVLKEWVETDEIEYELKLFQYLHTEKMIKFCNGFWANND